MNQPIPEPINMFLVGCMLLGLLLCAAGGFALTAWLVERLCNFIYMKMGASKAFIEFLYWRHSQRKKASDDRKAGDRTEDQ